MDGIEQLEDAARRLDAEEKAAKAFSVARQSLILGRGLSGQPRTEEERATRRGTAAFFTTLAMQLEPGARWTEQTAGTNGKSIVYNSDWWLSLSENERIGVLCHEVMHCAVSHMARRNGRDPQKWNVACDLAINGLIEDAGYSLPQCGVFAGRGPFADLPPGKSAEEYYPLIPEDFGDGEGGSDPGGCGRVEDAAGGSPAEQAATATDWQVRVAQAAAMAKQRGSLTDGIDRLVGELLEPSVDWRQELRQFVASKAKNDFSWARPNRRFVHQGQYLPSLHSEELGEIAVAIDTSGSIDDATLGQFAGELQGILECYPSRLTVLYHHAAVYRVDTWNPSDGPLRFSKPETGGTSHVPVFRRLEADGIEPVCLIALTDLYTEFPDAAPAFPVLWVVTGNNDAAPPFGQVVEVVG